MGRSLHIGAGLALALVMLSGLLLWPATAYTPGYFGVLEAHVWIGVALLALSPLAIAVHLVRTSSPGGRAGLWTVGGTLALVAAGGAALAAVLGGEPPDDHGGPGLHWTAQIVLLGLWEPEHLQAADVVLGALALAALTAVVSVATRAREPSVALRRSGVALTAVGLLALATGVGATWTRGDGRFNTMAAHSLLGVLTAVVLVAHFRTPRRLLPGWRGALALSGTVGLVTVGWAASYEAEHLSTARPDAVLESTPTRTLRSPLEPLGEALPAEALEGSATCGAAGCHEELTAEWEGSAHRFAADNVHYRSVIELLVDERGPAAASFCAGCHDPVRALAGSVEELYADGAPPPGEGVSCAACHGIVATTRAGGNARMTVRAPRRYPGMDDAVRERRIRRDPRAHRGEMTAGDQTVDASLCGACHRVELGPHMGAAVEVAVQATYPAGDGPESLMCSDCHMPIVEGAAGQGAQYAHHFAGANVDLPGYATHPAAEPEALRVVAGHARAMLAGLDEDGAPFPPGPLGRSEALAAAGRATESLELSVAGARGEGGLRLTITSRNLRVGHPVPVGPFDLREVWQHVVVRSGGTVVWEVGAPAAWVDPEAHRLGAKELARDGRPLERHRIWDVAAVEDKRVVPPLGAVQDVYAIPGAFDGPLEVEARWLMRRAGAEFVAFAHGPEHPGFAPVVLGAVTATVD